MKGIEEATKKLGEEPFTDIQMRIDEIRGRVSLSKDKVLLLSIPYSTGFTAYVDGKEALGEEPFTDIQMRIDEIRGRVSLSKDKVLLLSIPYSTGFTAYVDGKEAELKKANTMYMALELSEGEHEIRLTYKTPYSAAGQLLSVLGILVFILISRRKTLTYKKDLSVLGILVFILISRRKTLTYKKDTL